MSTTVWQIAVVGAGPVGLALALHAARVLPQAQITVFDARAADHDVTADPRTLALSLGSVQWLQQLQVWATIAPRSAPILSVHVSQAAPSLQTAWGPAEVSLSASALGVPQLGAVVGYGALLGPLQRAWDDAVQAQPHRLRSRFGSPVAALKPVPSGVEVDAGIVETFDLAVAAEGGLYGDAAGHRQTALTPAPLVQDYGQTAWIGTAELSGAPAGVAFERFTRDGPLALLPLPRPASDTRPDAPRCAALVWCVSSADDPVKLLDTPQRMAVLNSLLPASAGRVSALSALKPFALGLSAQRTLVQGRTVRIGNAAQTLHPVAGQGLNLGLRDAHELVSSLRWASDIDAALKRAEWARAPDRWSIIATTDFLARSFTWKLPGAATARGLGLAALRAAPPLQRLLARRLMFGSR